MKRTLTIAFSLYEKLMKQVIVMVLLFFSNVVHGQDALNTESWQYVKNVDEFTDEILETALVVAEGGLRTDSLRLIAGAIIILNIKSQRENILEIW
ncbi:hypothetical protein [Emcibacter nanhaiensis]|uniref:Uncharacterized protein n=1 Tax=Emcibacter nanhaiensis TaxID=1505037 RepID=A0A501PAN5_9PROT|nr:hypothetical protein [Emcibacter nanhaiensis]TPD57295.1 hypothetical protein FIV46_14295 [Emcibacter nanhaiensis]